MMERRMVERQIRMIVRQRKNTKTKEWKDKRRKIDKEWNDKKE